MSLKSRIQGLRAQCEAIANPPQKVDVAAILNAGRDRIALGLPSPPTEPLPPEWEHSHDGRKRRLFHARRQTKL